MLFFLPGPVKALISFSLYFINSVFWVPLVVVIAITRIFIPFAFWQAFTRKILDFIATTWIDFNNFNMWLLQDIDFEITGMEGLDKKSWYIVLSNHQSWVDILVLQKLFIRKIPFLKFFLKKELIWVPIMGIAWWALDFPFMKRYSRKELEKKPHLKGKDIEITRKACEKFKNIPVSVVNFVEGTRYTDSKHQKQNSPFEKLLKPKAGGVAFVLNSMGEMMTGIVNVTIVYPEGPKSFYQYMSGKLKKVKVHVEVIPVTDEMIGDYIRDEIFKNDFQNWVNRLWEKKDRQIGTMLATDP